MRHMIAPTCAAMLLAGSLAPAPASARLMVVKVAKPLLRTDAVATGGGSIGVSAKGPRVSVTFSVAALPDAVVAPLSVFLEDAVGAGTFTSVASIDTLSGGAGKVVLASTTGVPAALGVSNLADVVGRAVEVRSSMGTALLDATFPELTKFAGTKFKTKLAATQGSPLARASGKASGTFSAKSGAEKFLLKAKGLTQGVTYALYVEDGPGSGSFVAAGDLVGGKFLRDEAAGDRLPLGVATLAALGGRAMEVRDGTTPVVRGVVFLTAETWPQHHVILIGSNWLRYVPGIVVYRAPLLSTPIATLRADPDALWQLNCPTASSKGAECTVRLDSDVNQWWSVNATNGGTQHYLGIRSGTGPPPNLDQVTFILHRLGKIDGQTAVSLESKLFPGEYPVDQGNGLSANGVLIEPQKPTDTPLILR